MSKASMRTKLLQGFLLLLLPPLAHAQNFHLTSNDIQQGREIGDTYIQAGSGCTGGNVSPQLAWSGAPASTKSFAITMYDPDAPTGSGWWHWLVLNIPANVHSVPRDAGNNSRDKLPAGAVQGRTDFATVGYGGPCPPLGDRTHRYRFTIWALKTSHLDINKEMSAAQIGYMLHANAITSAELVALSTRAPR